MNFTQNINDYQKKSDTWTNKKNTSLKRNRTTSWNAETLSGILIQKRYKCHRIISNTLDRCDMIDSLQIAISERKYGLKDFL